MKLIKKYGLVLLMILVPCLLAAMIFSVEKIDRGVADAWRLCKQDTSQDKKVNEESYFSCMYLQGYTFNVEMAREDRGVFYRVWFPLRCHYPSWQDNVADRERAQWYQEAALCERMRIEAMDRQYYDPSYWSPTWLFKILRRLGLV